MRNLLLFTLTLTLLSQAEARTAKTLPERKPAPSKPAPAPASPPDDIQPSSQPSFYLDTMAYTHPAQTELAKAAMGMLQPTAEQTSQLIAQFSSSPQQRRILERYARGLYYRLGIDPYSKEAAIKASPRFFKGITNYVGSSDESMNDEGPSWISLNQTLRDGKPLDKTLAKFNDEILYSLSALPQVQGLVFRGKHLSKEEFDALTVGGSWPQPAYTSTSLTFDTARGFGAGRGGKKTGIIIIRLKQGTPVSPLTFDNGYRGQPGRLTEYEVLIPPGAILKVHHKVEDVKNETYFVFTEQL